VGLRWFFNGNFPFSQEKILMEIFMEEAILAAGGPPIRQKNKSLPFLIDFAFAFYRPTPATLFHSPFVPAFLSISYLETLSRRTRYILAI
jgi:hypothetical protein